MSRFVCARYGSGRTRGVGEHFAKVGEVAMTDSPVTVTPIFDQLVAEFGGHDRTAPDTGEREAAAEETAEDA